MKALLTGDSQVGALKRALDERSKRGADLPEGVEIEIRQLGPGPQMVNRFCFLERGRLKITHRELRENISSFPVSDITTYGLCAPLHTMRLMRSLDWKEFAPTALGSDGKAPVSSAMLRSLILEDQRGSLWFIDKMRSIGLEVFVIEAPRPFRHHPVFEMGVGEDVALLVDREYRRVIRAELDKRSVAVVEVPKEAYDEVGFMHEKYKQPIDAHHGNLVFGELMLDAVIEYLRNAKAVAPPPKKPAARPGVWRKTVGAVRQS